MFIKGRLVTAALDRNLNIWKVIVYAKEEKIFDKFLRR